MFKFVDNDTIAMVLLGTIAVIGLFLNQSEVAYTAVGAIGGFIGAQMVKKEWLNETFSYSWCRTWFRH